MFLVNAFSLLSSFYFHLFQKKIKFQFIIATETTNQFLFFFSLQFPEYIQSVEKLEEAEKKHDLVIASYVLGEIPSPNDRSTVVCQLWNLTDDLLVLIEPGTPQGADIISQMRSHILWMEIRKLLKPQRKTKKGKTVKNLLDLKVGAHIVAPVKYQTLKHFSFCEKHVFV